MLSAAPSSRDHEGASTSCERAEFLFCVTIAAILGGNCCLFAVEAITKVLLTAAPCEVSSTQFLGCGCAGSLLVGRDHTKRNDGNLRKLSYKWLSVSSNALSPTSCRSSGPLCTGPSLRWGSGCQVMRFKDRGPQGPLQGFQVCGRYHQRQLPLWVGEAGTVKKIFLERKVRGAQAQAKGPTSRLRLTQVRT